jgi:hypothetical protein
VSRRDIIDAWVWPGRLREVDGIGPVRAASILAAWAEQKAVREIMVFLHSHGVGTALAVRIHNPCPGKHRRFRNSAKPGQFPDFLPLHVVRQLAQAVLLRQAIERGGLPRTAILSAFVVVCRRPPTSALSVSHGENRGSSPLGSASKISDLIALPSRPTKRCLLFVYYPGRRTKKILWIGDRIIDVHKNRGTVFTLQAAPALKCCGART